VDVVALAERSLGMSSLPGDFDERVVDRGDLVRKRFLGVRRKGRAPVRPRRSFVLGLGVCGLSSADCPVGSPGTPEPVRFGVEPLRKTASLYRSTTPRANKLLPRVPLRSSPSASIKSQSSSSSSRSIRTSSSSFASERSRSSAGTPDFSRRVRFDR
jgi:hypothetical protein